MPGCTGTAAIIYVHAMIGMNVPTCSDEHSIFCADAHCVLTELQDFHVN